MLSSALPQTLTGQHVCLLRERGPGDQLFFLRFASHLKARGARITYRSTPKIASRLALIDDYIGVSNTNMHLRAGVGKTARVLVPCPAEWRWMAAGEESPWFPGFRIYRQTPDGDWSGALNKLRGDLLESLGKGNDSY